mgnify:FL=1
MAFNPSPDVAVARDAAKKLGATKCVVLYVLPDGHLGMASYGETKSLCKEAGKLGDKVFDMAMRDAWEVLPPSPEITQ